MELSIGLQLFCLCRFYCKRLQRAQDNWEVRKKNYKKNFNVIYCIIFADLLRMESILSFSTKAVQFFPLTFFYLISSYSHFSGTHLSQKRRICCIQILGKKAETYLNEQPMPLYINYTIFFNIVLVKLNYAFLIQENFYPHNKNIAL